MYCAFLFFDETCCEVRIAPRRRKINKWILRQAAAQGGAQRIGRQDGCARHRAGRLQARPRRARFLTSRACAESKSQP